MAREKLDDEEIAGRIHAMDGWSVRNGKLHRELKFVRGADEEAFVSFDEHHFACGISDAEKKRNFARMRHS